MSFLFRKESPPAPTPSPGSSQPMQISPQPGPASSPRQADSPSTSSAAMPAFHSSHSYSSHGGGLPTHGGLRSVDSSSQPGTPPPHESHLSRQNSTGSVGSSSGSVGGGGVSHSNPMLVTSKLSSSGSLHHIYQTNVLMTPSSSLPSTPNTHQSFLHSIPSIASELSSAAPSSSFSGAPGGAGVHATSGILTYPAPAASSASSSGLRSSPSYSPSSSPPPTNTAVQAPPALSLRVPTQGQDMPDSLNAPPDEVTLMRNMFANCGAPLSRSIFQLGDTLGTGTFGRVRIVTYLPSAAAAAAAAASAPASGASSTITATASSGPVVTPASPLIAAGRPLYFALKMLKKSEIIRLKQVEHIKAEKSILSRIAHPFIVNLYASFQDERNLYMTMEFICGGELFSQLRKVGRFSNDTARFYAAEIILALQYLHTKDIVYRDLKPENLLIDKEGHIKITDFGFAKVVEDRTWTLCGTPEYLAPEIIQSKGHGKAVDFWALGVLIFEMLAGYPPFYDENPFGIYQKILKGVIDFPRHMDPLAKDLIKKLLTADRTKRFGCLHAGAEDIKTHKWFAKVDWVALFQRTVKPPFVPAFRAPNDTSNFDRYPDSREGASQTQLNDKEKQLFADF